MRAYGRTVFTVATIIHAKIAQFSFRSNIAGSGIKSEAIVLGQHVVLINNSIGKDYFSEYNSS